MTDNDTLADHDIKDFGKSSSNQVSCYQCPTDIYSESIPSSYDRVCLECGNDHSFSGNIKDAITFIDLLPVLFPQIFKSNKLQEFVN